MSGGEAYSSTLKAHSKPPSPSGANQKPHIIKKTGSLPVLSIIKISSLSFKSPLSIPKFDIKLPVSNCHLCSGCSLHAAVESAGNNATVGVRNVGKENQDAVVISLCRI